MKKVIGLFLVIVLSTSSVFAQRKHHGGKQGRKALDGKRCEKLGQELNLDAKQTADFRKIHEDYKLKMQQERESLKTDRQAHRTKMLAMRDARKEEIKKILTDEQYQKYAEKKVKRGERRDGNHRGEYRRNKQSN